MKKLFVTNFDEQVDEEDISELFSQFGPIVCVRIKDGPQKRYAIVTMGNGSAERAIAGLNGEVWQGVALTVRDSIY
jgi:RNA recognition motif-containing protein